MSNLISNLSDTEKIKLFNQLNKNRPCDNKDGSHRYYTGKADIIPLRKSYYIISGSAPQ